MFTIERADAEATRPLRHRVLRPMQAPEELAYAGDYAPEALHAVARDASGAVIGTASITPEAHPLAPRPHDWRLRGLATAPEVRGAGAGRALLDACLTHARAHGAERVWCNARLAVEGFYARAGFVTESDVFETPPIGPHVRMALALTR